ncbi:S24 family peptidase [Pseudoramibacter alactolyticus]|uniref:S24 family peptidase n=1 Tax=Pseudoramibacter alactolyticus TaxID=113287 RepID=UPI0028EACB6F|nr:S24 family peptidase [Pseudoramibacter alactolyticus]
MKWNRNVAAFAPSAPYLVNRAETTWDEIPRTQKRGQAYIYVSVMDNSMYDRYTKGDLVIIKLTDDLSENLTGDALVQLPDASVCLKKIEMTNRRIKLIDRNELDPQSLSYPKAEVTILGFPTSVIRA